MWLLVWFSATFSLLEIQFKYRDTLINTWPSQSVEEDSRSPVRKAVPFSIVATGDPWRRPPQSLAPPSDLLCELLVMFSLPFIWVWFWPAVRNLSWVELSTAEALFGPTLESWTSSWCPLFLPCSTMQNILLVSECDTFRLLRHSSSVTYSSCCLWRLPFLPECIRMFSLKSLVGRHRWMRVGPKSKGRLSLRRARLLSWWLLWNWSCRCTSRIVISALPSG